MANLEKKSKKDKAKWIVVFTLIAGLLVAVFSLGIKLNNTETTKTVAGNLFNYEIGAVNTDGEFFKDTASCITKDFITVDGMEISIQDKANVTYSVYFFDKDKKIIEVASGNEDKFLDLSTKFDTANVPENAKYFKVCITPTNDAEVSIFEINDYASQISITVNK